jgi:hypothetical protein
LIAFRACSAMQIPGLTKPAKRHSPFESKFDPISLIVLLMLLLILALGFVYLERHFPDIQRHGAIIPKPAIKK